jgi:hypothetical protein
LGEVSLNQGAPHIASPTPFFFHHDHFHFAQVLDGLDRSGYFGENIMNEPLEKNTEKK